MLCSCVCSESADTRCVSRANENQSVATDIFTASAGRRTEWRRLERCSYGSPDRRTPPVSDQQIIVLYCIVFSSNRSEDTVTGLITKYKNNTIYIYIVKNSQNNSYNKVINHTIPILLT